MRANLTTIAGLVAVALVAGLVIVAPQPAQASDLERAAIALGVGALTYELLDGDDHYCYPARPGFDYRDWRHRHPGREKGKGYYRDWDGGNGHDCRARGKGYYRDWDGGDGLDIRRRGTGYYPDWEARPHDARKSGKERPRYIH